MGGGCQFVDKIHQICLVGHIIQGYKNRLPNLFLYCKYICRHVYLFFPFYVLSGKFQHFLKRGRFVQVYSEIGCHLADISETFVARIHISITVFVNCNMTQLVKMKKVQFRYTALVSLKVKNDILKKCFFNGAALYKN